MASHRAINAVAFKSDTASIAIGSVVKAGSDKSHVAKASAATDKAIGIAQSLVEAAEQAVEVAMVGGGAKALLGGTVSFGDFLASDSNGALVATTTANNKVIAQAMEDGVSGDLIAVEVVSFNY